MGTQYRKMVLGIAAVLWMSSADAFEKKEFAAAGPQPYILDKNSQPKPLYDESHALLISVSAYKGGWRPLRATTKEVDDIQAALQRHGFDIVRVYDPNGSELHQVYRDFVAKFGRRENSRLLFLFAGHGYTNKFGFGYIVPVDAADPNSNPDEFYNRATPIKVLVTVAEELAVKHALFIFDSCFSGSIFATRGSEQSPDPRGTALERKAFFEGGAQEPVRQFITAGNEQEEVPDNPLFGQLLIEALTVTGRASLHRDGYVTGKEVGLWLEQKVPQFADAKQSPHSHLIRDYKYAKGDMVFQVPNGIPAERDRVRDGIGLATPAVTLNDTPLNGLVPSWEPPRTPSPPPVPAPTGKPKSNPFLDNGLLGLLKAPISTDNTQRENPSALASPMMLAGSYRLEKSQELDLVGSPFDAHHPSFKGKLVIESMPDGMYRIRCAVTRRDVGTQSCVSGIYRIEQQRDRYLAILREHPSSKFELKPGQGILNTHEKGQNYENFYDWKRVGAEEVKDRYLERELQRQLDFIK